ncbi:MAG: YfhO family protein [Bacillota bacterium]|nr:YfhO family protein [Bacillota bacterium]
MGKSEKTAGLRPTMLRGQSHSLEHARRKLDRRLGRSRRNSEYLPLRPWRVLLLSFFCPLLIFAFAYAVQGFWPIGELFPSIGKGSATPLTIDLYHQYAPFLSELRHKLLNGQNLFYSWHGGLGINFYALIAYYLASPLNLILVLFPPVHLTEAVTVLTLLKIGLTGLTSAYMLQSGFAPYGIRTIGAHEPKENNYTSDVATDWITVVFATAFAVSGFMIAYAWNIMWLDAILLLPLVILGLTRLIRDGRFLLYTLALAGTIIVNYYIAVFVCIFTALYFFVAYFSAAPGLAAARRRPVLYFAKRFAQFAFFSLLAGGIAAFMALPTWLALQLTSATNDKMPQTWSLSFNFFDFLTRHLPNVKPAIRDGLPNVYMGLPVFILLPLYVVAPRIRLSEKVWHVGLLCFLYMSFNSNVLNFLWHGMHYPNQLPYRYAFVYSLLLIIMCYRALGSLGAVSAKMLALGAAGGIVFVILAEKLSPAEVTHTTALISILFLLLHTIALALRGRGGIQFRQMALVVVLFFMTELLLSTTLGIWQVNKNEHFTGRNGFIDDCVEMRDEVARIRSEDSDFYRLEMIQQKTTNSPALYGYPGFTLFASTSYEKTARLMRELGFHGNNINSYKYMSSTHLYNAIFGIRYLINKNAAIRDPLLEPLRENAGEMGFYTYRNPYALPIGFMVSNQLESWNTTVGSPFDKQNSFLAKSGGFAPAFYAAEIVTDSVSNFDMPSGNCQTGYQYNVIDSALAGEVVTRIINPVAQHIYFYVDSTRTMDVTIEITRPVAPVDNTGGDPETAGAAAGASRDSESGDPGATEPPATEQVYYETRNINKPEIFDAGFCDPGETIRVTYRFKEDKGGNFKLYAAGMDEPAFVAAAEKLAEGGMRVTAFNSNHVDGEVTAAEDGLLFLSIPYDAAWQARVDGEAVELIRLAGGLTALPLAAGSHAVNLHFVPAGFMPGLMISLGSLLLLLLLTLIYTLKQRRLAAARQDAAAIDAAREEHLRQMSRERGWQFTPGADAASGPEKVADFVEPDRDDAPDADAETAEPEHDLDAEDDYVFGQSRWRGRQFARQQAEAAAAAAESAAAPADPPAVEDVAATEPVTDADAQPGVETPAGDSGESFSMPPDFSAADAATPAADAAGSSAEGKPENEA